VWRLVVERVASLTELETTWSIDDVLDAADALEAVHRAEHEAARGATR
jgi:hypothetical protein